MARSSSPIDKTALTPKLRILFVEDHSESRRIIGKLLSESGYDVSVADCAGTALHLLNSNKFDVILSDIGLPDGSGYALIMLAKQCQASIMAVALTGFSEEQDVRFSREVGFDFHLTKPVDFHALRTVLNRSCRKKNAEVDVSPGDYLPAGGTQQKSSVAFPEHRPSDGQR